MNNKDATIEANTIVNLFKSQNFDKAITKGKQFIKKFPSALAIYNVIGLSFSNKRDNKSAIYYFKLALQIDPFFISTINNLGNSYKALGDFKEAKKQFDKAFKLNPKYFTTLINLGSYNRDINKGEEAIQFYLKGLEIKKDISVYFALSLVLASVGKKKEAKIYMEKIIELSPEFIPPQAYMVDYLKPNEEESYIKKIKSILKKENLSISDKILLTFALGKAYEKLKDFKNASLNYKQGNEIKDNSLNIDIKRDIKQFKLITDYFTNISFDKIKLKNQSDKKIIFIIGLPRSGTTLIEQILSSHKEVYGGGEMLDMSKIVFNNFFDVTISDIFLKKENLKNAFPDYKELGLEYMNNLERFETDKKIITDKAPLNFRWIGFIKLMLPNAKIIHCKRNQFDNFLSLYLNSFESDMSWVYSEEKN